MEPRSADTIAAIATAPGRGAVGIVRLSGQLSARIAERLSGRTPVARHAVLAPFLDRDDATIDRGLVLYFPAPGSYTGEDVVELQCHGGPVVLASVMDRCLELGAVPAKAGEFTERAFLNGKLDLAQAEAVADLIDASSRAAAQSAVRSLEGAFSREIEALRHECVALRILIEASLDFPEEEMDVIAEYDVPGRAGLLLDSVQQVIARAAQGRLLREGARVVLLGEANVGKSSLLNALAGEDVAIVTHLAGTTRDLIRVTIVVGGVPFHVIDTAGLRETADEVESIGIERAKDAARRADLLLMVTDGDAAPKIQHWLESEAADVPQVHVRNKADLRAEPAGEVTRTGAARLAVSVSAMTGAGIDALREVLLRSIGYAASESEGVFMARSRHLDALAKCAGHLKVGLEVSDRVELFAEELRYAEARLGDITGRRTPDDLLGDIFRSFCIGK